MWLVHDLEFDLEVAAKKATGEKNGEAAELLRQEFRVAKELIHEGIVRVHELHETEAGITFYTAEYLGGGDLGQLRGGPVVDVVNVVAEISDAMEYAHSSGVIHRDLKCGNILLDDKGHPHVSDFGIAGIVDPGDHDLQLIGGGSGINQSPQQTAGEPPAASDDIYALGTVIFELITGSPPFSDSATAEVQYGRTASRLSSIRSVPSELDDLAASMLSARASDRPESMAVVRDRLRGVAAAIMTTTPAPRSRTTAPIRVSAPPRAQEPRSAAKSKPADPSHARRSMRWSPSQIATGLVFLFLAVAAVGVFVYLPGWVKRNPQIVVGESRETESEDLDESMLNEANQAAAAEGMAESSRSVRDSVESESAQHPKVENRATTTGPRIQETALPEPENGSASPGDRQQEARSVSGPPKPASRQPKESARDFSRAMSDGLRSLETRNFTAAELSFQTALSIRPDSGEAIDGLARARQQLRLAAIEHHGARAKQFADAERWREAEAEFSAVLEIDSAIRFAMQGQELARQRADLNDRLEFHLARPERMSSLKVLNEAIDLLDRARSAEPDGPRIQQQISQLEQAIQVASTPVRIRLVSDNNTDVVIYRVGALGRFEQRQIELRPGSYTAVGSRDGYRDVRRVFKVGPEQTTDPVVVRCEEKI